MKEGDLVKRDQVLLRLHDVQYSAKYSKDAVERNILRARIARLHGEAVGSTELTFPPDLVASNPELIESERQMFAKRAEDLATLTKYSREKVVLLRRKLELFMPAIRSGSLSEIQKIDLESQILELEGNLATTRSGFVRQAMEQLDEDRAKLATLEEAMRSTEDQLSRATIRSPVNGVVNKLFADTAGRVIQGGQPIMEIVAETEGLLIEARIAPADIAFLAEGHVVKVRFTAYDFTVYGGLDGVVMTLGADTVDGDASEVFYPVKVRTQERTLGRDRLTGKDLALRPGMIAEVDILTGKRTVLEYLLNPIHRAQRLALREK